MSKPDKSEIRLLLRQHESELKQRRRISNLFWVSGIGLPLAFIANVGLALLGEPRALWFMQIIGVL